MNINESYLTDLLLFYRKWQTRFNNNEYKDVSIDASNSILYIKDALKQMEWIAHDYNIKIPNLDKFAISITY